MAILATVAMAAEETSTRDRSRLSIFVQPSVSFLDFSQREYFQDAIDTLYNNFKEDALTESESLYVAKQDFQKVNFCFPITGGIQYQIFPDNFVSVGLSFIYDNESVVLTDRKNRTHNYSYTIQGTPLFLEYRLGIPRNLMTLSGESLFSIAIRWYWVLPGTEIYPSWGKLEAKTPLTGSGFGLSVGYLIANWKFINIYGDVGFSSIKVKSDRMYSEIVPDGPEKKARWNIGGLTMQFRIGFGLWNEPEPIEENEDDTDKDSDAEAVQATEENTLEKAEENTAETSGNSPVESVPESTESANAEDTASKASSISPAENKNEATVPPEE